MLRYFALIIFNLISVFARSETIKLKFQLFSEYSSSIIKLESIKITPIKSYFVQEIEHHHKGNKTYNFRTFRFYYSEKFSCNIFEYEANEYPFKDIYLKIESDSFYYERPFESDSDEENCIHLTTKNITKISNVYIKPFRFINIMINNGITDSTDCIDIGLFQIFDKDTIRVSPTKKTLSIKSSESLLKTLALTNKNYILLFEFYGSNYCYYYQNISEKYFQLINIYKSDCIIYPVSEKSDSCTNIKTLIKQNKLIEYY